MSTHFHVVGAALADRNALVRQIGNRQQPAIASLLNGVELDAELLDLLRSLTAGLLDLRGVDALPLRTRNFISRRVLFALQSLELGEDPPATRFERGQLVGVVPSPRLDVRCAFGFRASPEIWTRFFATNPEPLYHDFFAMLMRVPEFVLEGDSLVAMQNARALHRMMNIMRETGAPNV